MCVCVYIYIYIYIYIINIIWLQEKSESAAGKKGVLPFSTTWIKLESIMLSELSQTKKKTNTIWYHVYVESKNAKLIETEGGIEVTRSEGVRVHKRD